MVPADLHPPLRHLAHRPGAPVARPTQTHSRAPAAPRQRSGVIRRPGLGAGPAVGQSPRGPPDPPGRPGLPATRRGADGSDPADRVARHPAPVLHLLSGPRVSQVHSPCTSAGITQKYTFLPRPRGGRRAASRPCRTRGRPPASPAGACGAAWAGRAVALGGGDHDAAVAAPEIVHHVGRGHAREPGEADWGKHGDASDRIICRPGQLLGWLAGGRTAARPRSALKMSPPRASTATPASAPMPVWTRLE